MEQNLILHKNLRLMYLGQLVEAVSLALLLVPVINLFALLGIIVGGVMSIVGLVKLRNQHPAYLSAVGLMVLALLINFLSSGEGLFSDILSMAGSLASLGMIYFVLQATNELLLAQGAEELVAFGQRVWRWEVGLTAVSIVITLLGYFLLKTALLLAIILLGASLIPLVLFIQYLSQASAVFR